MDKRKKKGYQISRTGFCWKRLPGFSREEAMKKSLLFLSRALCVKLNCRWCRILGNGGIPGCMENEGEAWWTCEEKQLSVFSMSWCWVGEFSWRSSSRVATVPRDFVFDLVLREVVLPRTLKPTTETTKKSRTSSDRQMLRIMFSFAMSISTHLLEYTKQISKKKPVLLLSSWCCYEKKARSAPCFFFL